MNPDNPLYKDLAELAALYVAGALPPDEATEVEVRLAEGDKALAAEIATYGTVINAFSEGTPPVEPDPKVKQALLDRIASPEVRGDARLASPELAADSTSKVFIRRDRRGDWVEFGIPGIQLCILFRDQERDVQTSLIRMAPGSELPAHFHRNFEECFVLEGEAESEGTSLSAGDYVRAPAGSPHGLTRSEKGCLLLLISELKG
jgi:mannose-6-phosphate isomerase-like protein (cupin superfamily)